MNLLDEARFHHDVSVRFRDLDPMGHAHHTMPLIYLEEARAKYWEEVAGRIGMAAIDYVMADVHVRYQSRIRWPGRLRVSIRTVHIGTKSFRMAFAISAGGETLVSGETTQVMYDFGRGCSIPVSDELRRRLAAYEGLPEPV